MKDYDFLFVLTEYSDNEGEEILVECPIIEEAYNTLANYGFNRNEVRFIEKMSVSEGEMLGLDTY